MFKFIKSFFSWFISESDLPLLTAHVHWVAGGLAPNNLPIFTAEVAVRVTAVFGRVEIASGKPATLMLVKAANGVAMTAAPALAAIMDVAGATATNQELALTDCAILSPGDSIGVQTTGDFSKAAGGITIHMVPLR